MTHPVIESDSNAESLAKTYTIRELAGELGVSRSTIMRVLDDTENLGFTVKVKSGTTTRFTETQASLIRNEILERRHKEVQRV